MALKRFDLSSAKSEWNDLVNEREKILKQKEADFDRLTLSANNDINDYQVGIYFNVLVHLLVRKLLPTILLE